VVRQFVEPGVPKPDVEVEEVARAFLVTTKDP
jgi:hypothetical protein